MAVLHYQLKLVWVEVMQPKYSQLPEVSLIKNIIMCLCPDNIQEMLDMFVLW